MVFSGKDVDWRMWKLRFLGNASHNGYRNILLGTHSPAVPREDEDIQPIDDDDTARIKARELNVQAYSALCISCEGAAFGIVERAFTAALPKGDAGLAWKGLCEKYEPKTQMSMVLLKKQFMQCVMARDGEPDIWFTDLSYFHSRINAAKKLSGGVR